jgi:hypothetical protein
MIRMAKSERNKGNAETIKAAEDFDDMLAEFWAADTNPAPLVRPSTFTSSSSNSNRSSIKALSALQAVRDRVPEENMVKSSCHLRR